jgi:serine/threonine protein kinase/tetratricopeptide (TPR) repeat protein
LFLNRDRNGRQVEYLSYATGRTERDRTTVVALAALLGRVTDGPVGPERLQALAEQSLTETASVEALVAAPPAPARLLGDYEVLAELGRGGMGVVYLARQLSLGRLVALKTLPADLVGDATALARFRREVGALARCEHPNIVKVLAGGTLPDGQPYYSMEYVPGCTLERVWQELTGPDRTADITRLDESTWAQAVLAAARKHREQTLGERPPPDRSTDAGAGATPALPLPPLPEAPSLPAHPGGYVRRVAALTRDAALALRAVHEQGIVHRDVKPGNLMLTPDGTRVVLMDFGLAKGQTASLSASRQGGLLGTLRYAAPEQLAAASVPVGPAADVRGLGATLWELLTRRRLFGEATDERQLSQQVLAADVPRLRQVEPSLDRDLEAVVARATERDAGRRIGSAGLLAEYLQLYLDGKPLPIRPPGAGELAWRWVRSHRGLVGALAASLAALTLLGVLAAVVVRQQHRLENEVHGYLDDVVSLQELGKYAEARAVVRRASALADASGRMELKRHVDQAEADLKMVDQLEDIPFSRIVPAKEGGLDFAGSDSRYAEAFRAYGVDPAAVDPAEAARRVATSTIREPLIVALDDWIYVKARLGAEADRLRAIAGLADADERRKQIREVVARKDRVELERLAGSADLNTHSPVTLIALARGLLASDAQHPAGEAFLWRIRRRYPSDLWVNWTLAVHLASTVPPRSEPAIGLYRAALAVRPKSPALHFDLAVALRDQGNPEEAVAEYQEALRLRPDYPVAHYNLGNTLHEQQNLAGAVAEYREAVRLKPDYFEAHSNLGYTLKEQGKPAEAVAEYREAVRLRPNDSEAHSNLGLALQEQGKSAEALAEFKEASRLRGVTWVRFPRGEYFMPSAPVVSPRIGTRVWLSPLSGARFYADTFAAEPKLADDMQAGTRYEAACAAALAGAGQGDAAALNEKERARWRKQALDWLRADLQHWTRQADSAAAADRNEARRKLLQWMEEADLAGLRDTSSLVRLREAEWNACLQLWAEVDALLRRLPEAK